MATQLEMTTAGYSKIETDTVELTVDKLEKIATIFGVRSSFILDFDDAQVFNKTSYSHPNTVIETTQVLKRIEEIERKITNFTI
jgi:transcriptional regulator with XRE-family HTH domain